MKTLTGRKPGVPDDLWRMLYTQLINSAKLASIPKPDPGRSPRMPLIRRWQDIIHHGPDWLTDAEEALIAACRAGTACDLGTTPPHYADPPSSHMIRADVLRYLILGGCDEKPVQSPGITLFGAVITGVLDLDFAQAHGGTTLNHCRFEATIKARQARFEVLSLEGSHLEGLHAQGATFTGNAHLHSLQAHDTVDLSGASIAGDLDCHGATFEPAAGFALNAQNIQINGSCVLQDITASGEVSLLSATIDGQLELNGATLSSGKGDAFNAQGMRVTSGLHWREVSVPKGWVDLTSARVGDLVDDAESWPEAGRLMLDGFTYERIGTTFNDWPGRIAWAEKGSTWHGEFFPQPFTHLAEVYRKMGHVGDARRVLYHRDILIQRFRQSRRLSRDANPRRTGPGWLAVWLSLPFRWITDNALRFGIGYGHKPQRSLWILLALTLLAAYPAHRAWQAGDMAPNTAPILISKDWLGVSDQPNPAHLWSTTTAPGRDYETFSALAYAVDLVIPIIGLGQTDAWAPSTARGPWGRTLWWARWVLSLAGWIVTALGAGAITGLIRRD